ncbi:MAG TPA: extracellular solute-binding protein, partial [Limnochordia bacterium]|nr:extracellular solute-binding protein [Limnochordia bacterium]
RGGLDWGWTSIVYAGGGRVLTDDNRKVAFDQPAAIEALDWLAKVYNQYRIGSLDVTFRTGRVAMGTAVLNMAQVAWNQQHIDSIGVAPVPPAENGAPSANVLFAEGVSIFNNDPARVQAAWKFIEWCATHQAQVDYVDKTGRIPARRDALARWADAAAPFSGGAAGVEVFSQAIQDGVAPPYGAHYTAMSKLLDPVIDNILSGKVAAAVALKSAAPAVQALLDATYGAP